MFKIRVLSENIPEHAFFLDSPGRSCSLLQYSEMIFSHSPNVTKGQSPSPPSWMDVTVPAHLPNSPRSSPSHQHQSLPSCKLTQGIQNNEVICVPNVPVPGHLNPCRLPKHFLRSRTSWPLHLCSRHRHILADTHPSVKRFAPFP